jgi:hypothetical protein
MTHAVAFGIGALVWGGWRHGHPGPEQPAAAQMEARKKASQRDSREPRSLKEILKSPAGMGADTPDFVEKGLELARSTRLPADPAAALTAELRKWAKEGGDNLKGSPEIFALIYQWMAADPGAFIQFAFSDPETAMLHQQMMDLIFPEAVRGMVADKGPLSLLPALTAPRNRYNQPSNLPDLLAESLVKTCDQSVIDSVREKVNKDQWSEVVRSLARSWPDDKGSELLQFAIKENNPSVMFWRSPRMPGLGAALLAAMSDESVPQTFRDALKNGGQMNYVINSDPAVPLETRLQYSFGDDPQAESKRMCMQDVEAVMSHGPVDWSHLYKVGAATAEEILAAVAAGTPDIAATDPEGLRREVFQHLAEQSPVKAMELLADLPEDKRNSTALMAARTYFTDVDPSLFLNLLQQIPSDTPELREERLDTWNMRANSNYGRLDDAFVEWVHALPAGIDREMALYSTARAAQATDKDLAAQLRSEVTDPGLLQKIAENR